MNVSNTILGIVLLLLFVGPAIFIILKSKASKKKLQSLTQKLLQEHQLQPTDEFEIGHHYFYLDNRGKKLLHIDLHKSKINSNTLWDLQEIKSFKPLYERYQSPSNEQFIKTIQLVVEEKSGSKKELFIYDENKDNIALVDNYRQAIESLVYHVNTLKS